jgi:hypothetical protein
LPAQQVGQVAADLRQQRHTGGRGVQRQRLGQQPHERADHAVAGRDGLPVVRLPGVLVGDQLRPHGHRADDRLAWARRAFHRSPHVARSTGPDAASSSSSTVRVTATSVADALSSLGIAANRALSVARRAGLISRVAISESNKSSASSTAAASRCRAVASSVAVLRGSARPFSSGALPAMP